MGRIRYIEEEKSTLLSAQYRKLEELETRKSQEIDSLRRQHREEIQRLKEDHQHAIDVYVVTSNSITYYAGDSVFGKL